VSRVEVQRALAGSFDLQLSPASGCGLRFLQAATGRRGSRLSGRRLVAQRRAVWGLAFAEQGRDDCHRLILREPKQQN
jgi:hypothetical protein